MAKVPFTKLKCKINNNEIPLQIGEETIVVKQYLPIQEKLALISRVITQAHEQDANYSNPLKAAVITDLEMIFAYTNISFTEKQKEDFPKLYDLLYSSGIADKILNAIPGDEKFIINTGVRESIEAVYKYQNSILGILDTLKTDYSNLNLETEELEKKLTNPEALGLVKDVLTKLS